MTTLLEYSSSVTRLSHFREYIQTEYPNLVLNYIVTNASKNDQNHSITMEFNGSLSDSTIESISTSINSYTNPTDNIIDFSTFFSLPPKKIVSTTYTKITELCFNPGIGLLSTIKINSFKNSTEAFDYSLRIIDLNNGTVIQEQTGLNNQQEISIVFGSLTNIPITSSIFEIHAKLDSENTTGGIIINSFELIYCQI